MTNLLKLFFCFLLIGGAAQAQECTTPGQNPSTAFPVCGSTVFHQNSVPACYTHSLIVPGCDGGASAYSDANPFWYKFTCFESGTLGFWITPANLGDDYDWQLFDITGHKPDDVFYDQSIIVTANWAGTYGTTGASNSGVDFIQCGSDPAAKKNTFAKMPQIVKGHTYLLLISHFSGDNQSGYDLSFFGGTAVITDPTTPNLKSGDLNCSNDRIAIKLNKGIKCSSIAADGSDFSINASGISITGSTGIGCSERFDTDSLELQLSGELPPGTYTLNIKAGTDSNTLLDYCDNEVPTTDQLQFVIKEKQPTEMDSLMPVACAPQEIALVFKKAIRCPTVAADGSNFKLSGTYPAEITSASCEADLSKVIVLHLDNPLLLQGDFTVKLQKDFDGNTIIDECGEETPEGSRLNFSTKDTVNAAFAYTIKYGCVKDTIAVSHPIENGITEWIWNLDDGQKSNTPSAQGIYSIFNEKRISLAVSNGICSDTAETTVLLDNYLKADFTGFDDICPNEAVTFTGAPQGKIQSHLWEFGDGGTANTQEANYTFTTPNREQILTVRYTVTDSFGCKSTASKPVTVYTSCYLAVPTAFTPNNDGLNDFLAPLNAVKANDLSFRVYNRWGQLVFESSNWKKGWDGNFKGQPQPTATYVWMLQYTNRDTGKKQQAKGTAVLIR